MRVYPDACTFGRCREASVALVTSPYTLQDEARCHYHLQVATGGRRSPGSFRDGSVRLVADPRATTWHNVTIPRQRRYRIVRWLTTVIDYGRTA